MATNDIQIRNDDGEFVSIFPIPVSQGGTGATGADAARTNLRVCGIENVVTSAYIGQQESSSQGCRIIVSGPVGGRTIFFNESGTIGYYDNEQSKTLWSYPSKSKLEAYPIGALYISYVSTSPATLFGGSWSQISGRFLYCTTSTGTGGNNNHTLTIDQIPSHNHAPQSGVKFVHKIDNTTTWPEYDITVARGGPANVWYKYLTATGNRGGANLTTTCPLIKECIAGDEQLSWWL